MAKKITLSADDLKKFSLNRIIKEGELIFFQEYQAKVETAQQIGNKITYKGYLLEDGELSETAFTARILLSWESGTITIT